MTILRSVLLLGLIAAVLGACSAGTAASASPAASSPPAAQPSPTDPPPTEVPGGIGSEPGDSGVVGGGGVPGAPPADGQPQLVAPQPGTIDPQPVSIETLEARVEDGGVTVVATWWSGVEPCYVLDTVAVKQDGNEFTVSLTEGSGDRDAMCIEIAVQKATAVDLGELAPGEYTVRAQDGTAEPVTFTVG